MYLLEKSRAVSGPGRFLAGDRIAPYGAKLTRRYIRTIRRMILCFLRMPFAWDVFLQVSLFHSTSAGRPALCGDAGRRRTDTGLGIQERSADMAGAFLFAGHGCRAPGIARPPGQAVLWPGPFFGLARAAAGESSYY